MKKASRNLVLRGETLRTLADTDLSRVAGGNDSNLKQCPMGIVVPMASAQCIR